VLSRLQWEESLFEWNRDEIVSVCGDRDGVAGKMSATYINTTTLGETVSSSLSQQRRK
jgi:hypothetical protein